MITTRIRVLAVTVLLVSLASFSPAAQSPHELFQQALAKERAEGAFQQAIVLYERVVREAGSDRALAARALVQMAGCYERIGQPTEARAKYQQIVREYADVAEAAAAARTRLAASGARPPGASGSGAAPRGAAAEGARRLALTKASEPALEKTKLWAGKVSPDGRYVVSGNVAGEGRWASPFRNLIVRDLVTGEARILDGNRFSWSGEKPGDLVRTDVVPPGTGPPQTGDAVRIHDFAWSPDSKRLIYLKGYSDRATGVGQSELRVINIDGTGGRVIVARSPEDWWRPVDWSPDGRYVAVSNEGAVFSLGIVSLTDGSIRELKSLSERDFYWCLGRPAFSPDGRYLAFTHGTRDTPCDVSVFAVDGSGEQPLIEHPANDEFVAWTPDGSLLFTSDRSGTEDLWLVPVAEGRTQALPRRVKQDIGRVWVRGFTRSGDLYFQAPGPQRGPGDGCCDLGETVNDVYVATLDPQSGDLLSAPAAVAPRNRGRNHSPSWSPDGRYLMYRTRDVRSKMWTELALLSLESGEERRVRPDITAGLAQRESWPSPDGRSVVVWTAGQERALYRIDVETGGASRLGTAAGEVTVLRNGESLVNVPPDRLSIVLRNLDTGAERVVYRAPAGAQIHGVAGSADSEQIVFQHVADRVAKLMVLSVADDTVKEITRLRAHARNGQFLAWSPDGRFIYYVDRPSPNLDKDELWRAPVAGGAPTRLLAVDGPIWNPDVHPSGRYIAFASEHFEEPSEWVLRGFLPTAFERPETGGRQ